MLKPRTSMQIPEFLPKLWAKIGVPALLGIGSILVFGSPAAAAPGPLEACHFAPQPDTNPLEYAVTWTPPADTINIDGYVIERRPENNWYWRHKSTNTESSWWDDRAGSAGTNVSDYRIRVKDTSGAFSAYVECAPIGDIGPAAVTHAPSGNSTNVTLTWDHVPGATGYVVHRDDSTNPVATVTTGSPVAGSYSAQDFGVTDGHYKWSVTPIADAPTNNGFINTWVSPTSSAEVTAPADTTSVSATLAANQSGATITWDSVAGATGYNIHRWIDGQIQTTPLDWVSASDPRTITDDLNSLTSSGLHWTVEATAKGNVRGNRVASNAVTLDLDAPSNPTGLNITDDTQTSVSLSWDGSTDNIGVDRYELYSDTSAQPNGVGDTLVATSTTTSATVTGLTVGDYNFYVTALDAVGNKSGPSNTAAHAIVPQDPPAQPAAPLVTQGNANFTLSVSWATDPEADTYNVYRDLADGVTGSPIATGLTGTTWDDPKVFPSDSKHTYRVAAVNENGLSPISEKSVAVAATADQSCDSGAATGQWHTEQVCDIWQIVDPGGQVTHWNAVNVRGHSLTANYTLDDEDIQALAERFGEVRLTLTWSQMHTTPNSLDNGAVNRIVDLLDLFDQHNVDVILDPIHLGGATETSNSFWMPGWAWANAGITNLSDRTHTASYPVWAGADNKGGPIKDYLNRLANRGILTHPAVIAVEVVNEPHPLSKDDGAASKISQDLQAEVYVELARHIQGIQQSRAADTRLVVLGAFHGGTRYGGQITNGDFAFNSARDRITAADVTNIVWTAHNYFTGVDDVDGQNDGQKINGARKRGRWAENATDSYGCYANANPPESGRLNSGWTCDGTMPQRGEAQQGHELNAKRHFEYSQQASMPFFMGEWGVPRRRFQNNQYRGYGNATSFFNDKIAAYSNVDGNGNQISWAVWSFDAAVDGFGLYMSKNVGTSGKDYLPGKQWVDQGTFPDNTDQGQWNGLSWEYSKAFK